MMKLLSKVGIILVGVLWLFIVVNVNFDTTLMQDEIDDLKKENIELEKRLEKMSEKYWNENVLVDK